MGERLFQEGDELSECPDILELQGQVNKCLAGRKGLRVLEAGCGSASYLSFGEDSYRIGIDLSCEQLEENKVLNEKIIGDIQTYELPEASYDVIVCWNVLEHVNDPLGAVAHFCKAVKQEGIIVLALPHFWSFKGLVTKWSPHWFHVWYYRSILGYELAGQPGKVPFHTFLKGTLAPKKLESFAKTQGVQVVYSRVYEAGQQKRVRSRFRLIDLLMGFLGGMIQVITLNRVNMNLTDYFLILRKPSVSKTSPGRS